ncbi:MAG: glucosaminidase domain-containing protein [Treponema sp.]|nr:glucosaminidase domain-containing protein [Treponema sp.]
MKQPEINFVTQASLLILLSLFVLFSCKSVPTKPKEILSRRLLDTGKLSAVQLADFFLTGNPDIDYEEILDFADIYITEAAAENINSDIAFAQMCLETGFLRFGGLVQPEWHNYCGLGAINTEQPGCIFETPQLGVRAHIQHLQAYATTAEIELNNELVDPRYSWVHKTKFARTVGDMALSWAADPEYACKLEKLLERMEESINR